MTPAEDAGRVLQAAFFAPGRMNLLEMDGVPKGRIAMRTRVDRKSNNGARAVLGERGVNGRTARRSARRAAGGEAGLTLLEVILALIILGVGMVIALNIFPQGVKTSERVENQTRARLLAESLLESIKANAAGFPHLPEGFTIPIPGDGIDNDGDWDVLVHDQNENRRPDRDYDGMPQSDVTTWFTAQDTDGDGVPGDNGDGLYQLRPNPNAYNSDGNPFYDPEDAIDEEFADGIDNDGDGFIDEDTRPATQLIAGDPSLLFFQRADGVLRPSRDALGPGNGWDDDGDGEVGSPTIDIIGYDGRVRTVAVADGIDNNKDGRIDEGIDEEIYNGLDEDGDGLIDEDCRLAAIPYNPLPFSGANENFSWQVAVGFVPDNGGNQVDDDFDGLTDEEALNNFDDDLDGLTDEDTFASPLPGYLMATVRVTWGGDRLDDDRDGYIDEEFPDGLDNDFDGAIDEDLHVFAYELSGVVELRN